MTQGSLPSSRLEGDNGSKATRRRVVRVHLPGCPTAKGRWWQQIMGYSPHWSKGCSTSSSTTMPPNNWRCALGRKPRRIKLVSKRNWLQRWSRRVPEADLGDRTAVDKTSVVDRGPMGRSGSGNARAGSSMLSVLAVAETPRATGGGFSPQVPVAIRKLEALTRALAA